MCFSTKEYFDFDLNFVIVFVIGFYFYFLINVLW
jgi:hypothetical protein